ncbi:hypothetical protein Nepgr_007780 [Nepenthes gracilis]|uniref:Uncharacterized protein n=1 Tax=Nepenthes gracilis TaxID=150966 RepID=A0AAD3XIS3_NEPGR|nr:hypothetical protein Nepgr_007780 [Nepenthes gracilis]
MACCSISCTGSAKLDTRVSSMLRICQSPIPEVFSPVCMPCPPWGLNPWPMDLPFTTAMCLVLAASGCLPFSNSLHSLRAWPALPQ